VLAFGPFSPAGRPERTQRPSSGPYGVGPDQFGAGGISVGLSGVVSGTIPVVQGAAGLMVAQINQHLFITYSLSQHIVAGTVKRWELEDG
jgi:hypothetical protein